MVEHIDPLAGICPTVSRSGFPQTRQELAHVPDNVIIARMSCIHIRINIKPLFLSIIWGDFASDYPATYVFDFRDFGRLQ